MIYEYEPPAQDVSATHETPAQEMTGESITPRPDDTLIAVHGQPQEIEGLLDVIDYSSRDHKVTMQAGLIRLPDAPWLGADTHGAVLFAPAAARLDHPLMGQTWSDLCPQVGITIANRTEVVQYREGSVIRRLPRPQK